MQCMNCFLFKLRIENKRQRQRQTVLNFMHFYLKPKCKWFGKVLIATHSTHCMRITRFTRSFTIELFSFFLWVSHSCQVWEQFRKVWITNVNSFISFHIHSHLILGKVLNFTTKWTLVQLLFNSMYAFLIIKTQKLIVEWIWCVCAKTNTIVHSASN